MNINKIKEKMRMAIKIRDEIQDIFKKYNVRTTYCKDLPNPFYHQISEEGEGFICEYYYGHPSQIYTPLGEIRITASSYSPGNDDEKMLKEIEEKFGFIIHKEEVYNKMWGCFGPWYHITKLPWNDTSLKNDSIYREKSDYINYDEAIRIYNEVMNEVVE